MLRVPLFVALTLVASPTAAQESIGGATPAPVEPVSVSAGLGVTRAWTGRPVPFWVRVRNRTAAELTSLSVAALDPRTVVLSLCDGSEPINCASMPPLTGPHQDVVLRGEIVTHAVADLNPTLIVRWTTAGVPAAAIVSAGALKSESHAWSWISWGFEWIQDLALPIALVAVGHMYERRRQREQEDARKHEFELERQRQDDAARRAEARQQREAERAELREQEATRRAEQQEVLRMMLPVSHGYAIKHYATIHTRAKSVINGVAAYRNGAPDTQAEVLDVVTADIVALYAANRRLIYEVGAYYLKDRAGEDLVVAAFNMFSGVLFDSATSKAIAPVIDVIVTSPPLPQATFERKIAAAGASAELAVVRQRVEEWLKGETCQAGIGYLSHFRAVLEFEMNRPYENWYGGCDPLVLPAEHADALEQICQENPEDAERFRAYAAKHAKKASPPTTT